MRHSLRWNDNKRFSYTFSLGSDPNPLWSTYSMSDLNVYNFPVINYKTWRQLYVDFMTLSFDLSQV